MTFTTLKDDFVDDVLNTEFNTNVKYVLVDNGDGTVSLVDATKYSVLGDVFNAPVLNATNAVVNAIGNQVTQNTTNISTNASAITTLGQVDAALADSLSTVNTALASLDARIDDFATLTEGSTTGDAELIGGRTVNGVTYNNLGDAINAVYSQLYRQLRKFNAVDVSEEYVTRTNQTYKGLTWTWAGETLTVSGTSESTTVLPLVALKTALPPNIVAGGKYRIAYKTTDPRVQFSPVFYDSTDKPTYLYFTGDDKLEVPANAVKWGLRFYVNGNVAITTPAVITEAAIVLHTPPQQIVDHHIYGEKSSANNIPASITYWLIANNYDSENRATPANIPVNTYCLTSGERLSGFEGVKDTGGYLVMCLANLYNPAARMYITIPQGNYGEVMYGLTANSGETVSWHGFFDKYLFGGKDKDDNDPANLTYFYIHHNFDSENRADPADIPINSYCITKGYRLSDSFDGVIDNGDYILMCLANMVNTNARTYTIIPIGINHPTYYGVTTDGGATVKWRNSKSTNDEIKVLCIGSSFGQDSVVYAPFIMDNMTDTVTCTMGIAYSSGASISDYNTWFDNGNNQIHYYRRNAGNGAWSYAGQKTIKQILTDRKWDVILFNQSALDGGVWSSFSNLNSLIKKVTNYVSAQNHKGVKLGYVMPQASLTYSYRYVYSDMVTCVQNILNTTPIEFFIPCGTAIETARGTSLNSIGDAGGLTYDAGTGAGHLQEGLPVLLSSYVTAMSLLDLCGVKYKGVMGDTVRPDATWVSSHAIPGQNGASTGVTDANCLLAQKCAVSAIKKPLETSTIVE